MMMNIDLANRTAVVSANVQQRLDAESRMSGASPQDILARSQQRIPPGRFGTAGEVASVAVFLASDAASYAAGAIFAMDGGTLAVI